MCLVAVVGPIDPREELEPEVHRQVEKVVGTKEAEREENKPEVVGVYELGKRSGV
jgi:hypothetical protein